MRLRWGIVFLLCFIYWGYLFFASQMSIQFDAASYEDIGRMLHEKGWLEYFKSGPHREPLYPLVISWSMDIGQRLSVPYLCIQKLIQIVILLSTQLLANVLLKKLDIKEGVRQGIVLYIGFSPAIVNATFSLFSEIIVFPFVLLIVWMAFHSWRSVFTDGPGRVTLWAIGTALVFLLATFGKAIFQYIFWMYLGIFLLVLFEKKQYRLPRWTNACIYVIVSCFIFGAFIISYKAANRNYNGQYVFTDRFSDLLYGNVVKRTNPLGPRMYLAHVASVPGTGVCRMFFSEEECLYCEFHKADYFRGQLASDLKEGIPKDELVCAKIKVAIGKVFQNPIQYTVLTLIESLRMPFWESTQIGNVSYPSGLQKAFEWGPFKNSIRLAVSVLTYVSLIVLGWFVVRDQKKLFDFSSTEGRHLQLYFFILFIIVAYTLFHSFFSIVTRYALPIASLYLIVIACILQKRIDHAQQ